MTRRSNLGVAIRRIGGRTGLLLFGAACAAIYTVEATVASRLTRDPHPELMATAILLDLVVLVPALAWLTVGRRRNWPPIRLVPFGIAGLLFAGWWIPEPHRGALDVAHLLFVPLELALIGWIGWRATTAIRSARKSARTTDGDLLRALTRTAGEMLGSRRAGAAMGYEIAVLTYAFAAPRIESDPPGTRSFTHHRGTAYSAVVLVVMMVAVVETAGVHLLVQLWSPVAAWVLTAIGLYAFVWIIADLRALSRRPSRTDSDGLDLRLGLRWTLRIPWADLIHVERISEKSASRSKTGLNCVLLGQPTHRLTLARQVTAVGPYGIERQVDTIELAVDDAPDFDRIVSGWAPQSNPWQETS